MKAQLSQRAQADRNVVSTHEVQMRAGVTQKARSGFSQRIQRRDSISSGAFPDFAQRPPLPICCVVMLEDDDLTFDALADEYGIDSSTSSDHFTGHGASLPERNPSPQQSNEILSFGTRNQFSSEPDGGYSSPSPAFFAHTQSPNGQYGLPAQAGETFNFSRLQPGPYLPAFDDFRFGVNVEQDLQAGPVRHNISTVQQGICSAQRQAPVYQPRNRPSANNVALCRLGPS